ncbi:MAG: cytochrome C [Desulfobacterales bacterium SG8_35_2]|nr:MAG: cytochrome C [Desulfobacterales bacterium SG8_35_2]
MKFRYTPIIFLSAALVVLIALSLVSAQDKFKLREGAAGKLCLGCHEGLQEKMKKKFIHTPLTEGDCVGCHNPHTSNYNMLLAASDDTICYTCHDSVVPENAKSVHLVVAEGKCNACHDPHAADYKKNLLRGGSELCYECHQSLVTQINENKYGHPPVKEDCAGCHDPHGSTNNDNLLNNGSPAICLKCHSADKSTFKSLHRNYPVEKADCTSCHNPHGSNTAAMLYDNVHEPVAKRNCERCHVEPTSSKPFDLKASGYETCLACHYEMITEVMNQSNIHWPLVDQKGCINCHSPHASSVKKLMRQPILEVCAKCHADTVARQERSATKHPPIAEGECGACHSPHSSDYQFILKDESVVEICAECHEWQTHTTHPIGEEFADPRNKNVTMQCMSCHRTHGTEYKHFIYYSTINELCVQCHVSLRR